jgi:hypothetical protein
MNRSESIGALAKALCAAQAAVNNPKMDSTNPAFNSKYASLTAVRDAVIPVFAKHNIAVLQHLTTQDSTLLCETVLLHESGEFMSSVLAMPIGPKLSGHTVLSAATYARRGALMAIAGVVGDADDDGNAVSLDTKPQRIESKPATPEQVAEIQELIQKTGSDSVKFLRYLKIEALNEMNSQQFELAKKALQAKMRVAA